MNILFISPQTYPNGMASSKRVRLFAEYLAKTHKVKALVCGRGNGDNPLNGKKDNVVWKHSKFSRLDYFLNFPKIYRLLKQNYSKEDSNIILLYDGIGLRNILFAVIGRRLKYKVFTDIVEDYSVHQERTSFWLSSLYKIDARFDRKINCFVDGIIVISSRLFSKYKDLSFPEEKMCLIPISAENIQNKFARGNTSGFRFVYSGSFGNKDGVEDLIDAMKKVNSKYPDIELILSGKINKHIESKIESEPYIKYVGLIPEEDYYKFLSEANVLLMTRVDTKYANTGFPFKLGEYLATGNLVIATDVSDVSSYLKDKESALIALPSNVPSLFSKMEYALLNKAEGEKIGLKGREVCEEHFSPEVNGKKLNSFIESRLNTQ